MKQRSKRLLSVLLTLVMLLGMVPGVAWAEGTENTEGTDNAPYTVAPDTQPVKKMLGATRLLGTPNGIALTQTNGELGAGSYYLSGDLTLTGTLTVSEGEVTLNLNGYALKGSGSGSVIQVTGGKLTIIDTYEGTREHKFTKVDNGAWTLNENGTETITGGVITGGTGTPDNTYGGQGVTNGGGIYVGGGVLILNGGTVIGNQATAGGGIYIDYYSGFTMNENAAIIGNQATVNETASLDGGFGGGVYVSSEGEYRVDGTEKWTKYAFAIDGTISYNNAVKGGGIYTAQVSNTTISATIEHNTAENGGGVYDDGYEPVLQSSTIRYNSATTDGGGVYAAQGTLVIRDATIITHNTASGKGGGVFLYWCGDELYESASVALNGEGLRIKDNTGGNLYLSREKDVEPYRNTADWELYYSTKPYTKNDKIVVALDINGNDKNIIGITLGTVGGTGQFTGLINQYDIEEQEFTNDTAESLLSSGYFFSDNPGLTVALTEDKKELQLIAPPHAHKLDGTAGEEGTVTFTRFSTLTPTNGVYTIAPSEGQPLSYYLDADVTGRIVITGGTVNLCLNGHKIDANGTNNSAISVSESATLRLCDCHAHHSAEAAEWHYYKVVDGLGVVQERQDSNTVGSFTGGYITGGSTGGEGGGLDVTSGNVYLYDVTIIGNTADNGGGVSLPNSDGTFSFNNVNIIGNKAGKQGGGIFSANPVTVSGGSISDNTAGTYGGGVEFQAYGKTLALTGVTMSRNKAGTYGGGVHMNKYNVTLAMTGGQITDNTAGTEGGGVDFANDASFLKLSGEVRITDNKLSDNTASNAYLVHSTGEHGSVAFVTIGESGMASGSKVGITLGTSDGKGVFTKDIADDTARDAAKPYFFSDDPALIVLPTVAADNAEHQLKLDVVGYAKLENLSIANSTKNTRDGSNGNPNPQILDALRAVATDNSETPLPATPVTYQWYRADSKDGTYTAIPDATAESYTTAAEDEGKYFKVVATQSVDENLHPLTQPITKEAVIGPVVKPAVTVSGVTRYSRTLTPVLSPADAAHFTYTWYRLSEPNAETGSSPAGTGESYPLGVGDIGKYLRVVVSVDEAYAPQYPAFKDGRIFGTSEQIEPDEYITPVLTANKTVASAVSGKGKIVINGFENYRSDGVYAFSPDDGKTWFTESGTKGGVTVEITTRGEGQTPLVTFTGLDVNATYYLRVRGEEKKQDGIVVIRQGTASNALPVKTPSSNIPLESAAIVGTARVGDTLVAKIEPANATIARYEWFRGADLTQPIENGTAYTLINKDYNKAITLKVTDANGTEKTAVISAGANGGATVQQAPAAKPNANSFRLIATTTGITVNGFANTSTRHYQYRLNDGAWQDENTFSASPSTSYTVSVRTGGPKTDDGEIPADWQAFSEENGYIVSKSVTTPANPNPFDDALTVSMNGYTYGTAGIIPALSSALKGGATPAWQYRAAGASGWQNWTASEALNVGTYEMRAVIAAVTGYSAYTTATTLFTVSPAKLPTPAASASGTTVTVTDKVPASKKVQFVVVDYDNPLGGSVTEWKTATLDGSNQFTLTGLKESYHYAVYLRSVPAASDVNHTYSDWSAKAEGTTPETKTVVFDLNGGKVKSGSTFALTATFTESPYALPDGEALERTGYTFAGWKQDGGATVGSVTSGGTCTAQWTPISYSIAFDANGGSGAMTAIATVKYGEAVRLSANTYTNGSNIFAGWATAANGKVAYLDGQSVMNLSATDGAQVTLYAVWKTAFTVSGNVYSAETGKVELTLTQGNVQLGSVLILPLSPNSGASAQDGSDAYAQSYLFNNVPDGTYNLIARQSVERLGSGNALYNETLTVTAVVTVSGGDATLNIRMPARDYGATVSVSGDGTPPVVVKGLDSEAESSALEERSVQIEMSVEKQDEATADQETRDAMAAIAEEAAKTASANEQRDYVNIDIEKEVRKNGVRESREAVRETGSLLEIFIPYDLTGKLAHQIALYRNHNGAPAKLGTSVSNGSYYTLDWARNLIVLHTKLFSTYAIGYDPNATAPNNTPINNNNNNNNYTGGGSSDSSSDSYAVTVAKSANGTVKADRSTASAGTRVTVTATPDSGCKVDSVTVTDKNGRTVPVTRNSDGTYRFNMPESAVTVNVTFAKKFADPADTGVANWLNTDDHILYIRGYNEKGVSTVRPDNNITRAEAAMMFYRLLKNQDVTVTKTFTDVSEGKWYAQPIGVLASLGIVGGYGDGTFLPNRTITRADFAKIATRFATLTGGKAQFSDVPAGHWAGGFIATAADYGWSGGYEDGTYRPNDFMTRAAAAKIINYMLGRAADREYVLSNRDTLVKYTDLTDPNVWYYFELVEASVAHDFTVTDGVEKWK